MMKEDGVKARFVRGGSTKYLVELLNEGLTDYILDGQTFDFDAFAPWPTILAMSPVLRSLRTTIMARETSPRWWMPWFSGATEVDVNFNGNVVTHSDGRLLHGIGGWQNCLASQCTILAVPSFRDRIPVIVDEVTTLTGPGELIDVIATERGIAINPRRQDLLDAVKGSKLPIRPMQDIKAEVERICGGKPTRPQIGRPSLRRGEVGGRHRDRYGMAGWLIHSPRCRLQYDEECSTSRSSLAIEMTKEPITA